MAYQTFRLPVAATPEEAEVVNAFLRGRSLVTVRKEWVAAGDASDRAGSSRRLDGN